MTEDSIRKINHFLENPTTSEFARTVLCKALNRELSQSLNDTINVMTMRKEVFNAEFVIEYKRFKG